MYKHTKDNLAIIRKSDGALIPMAEGNRDYQEYREWLAKGGVPESAQTEAEIIAEERAKRKALRTEKVEKIVVEVEGLKFDGDETSQNRMARTIVAMQTYGIGTIPWTLADNTIVEVTQAHLVQAILLSGQAQSSMWGI